MVLLCTERTIVQLPPLAIDPPVNDTEVPELLNAGLIVPAQLFDVVVTESPATLLVLVNVSVNATELNDWNELGLEIV